MAAYVVHAFKGMHRGIELREAVRADLILPKDSFDEGVPLLDTRVLRPKSAWAGPPIQHARITDPLTVAFLQAVHGLLPRDAKLYTLSAAQLRSRWEVLMRLLGLEKLHIQLRSLRGGGTVELFEQTESVERVMWAGRWSTQRSLVYYVQDALARRSLGTLSRETRDHDVRLLSGMYERVLLKFLAG